MITLVIKHPNQNNVLKKFVISFLNTNHEIYKTSYDNIKINLEVGVH